MVKQVEETTYSCGHQEVRGGTIADPGGLLTDVRMYYKNSGVCSVCDNPGKYPDIVKGRILSS